MACGTEVWDKVVYREEEEGADGGVEGGVEGGEGRGRRGRAEVWWVVGMGASQALGGDGERGKVGEFEEWGVIRGQGGERARCPLVLQRIQ